jgi:N-acetylmuramoyl-L-alanine amidase
VTLRILIDPGHGGTDPGIRRDALIEKEVNLQLARELVLSLVGLPVEVDVTRDGDYGMALSQRGTREREFGADFVLSIHVNGHPGSSEIAGLEAYYWPGSVLGLAVARTIVTSAPAPLRVERIIKAYDDPDTSDDDWLQNPRAVIGAYNAPCVLAECGYATNESDRNYLLTRWGRAATVCALRAGVVAAAQLLEVRSI